MTLRLFIVDQSAEFSQALASTLIDLEIGLCVASVTTEQEAAVWLRDHPEGWDVLVLEPRLKAGNGHLDMPRYSPVSLSFIFMTVCRASMIGL